MDTKLAAGSGEQPLENVEAWGLAWDRHEGMAEELRRKA